VKPQREAAAMRNAIGARRAEYWWHYDAQAKELYSTIKTLPFVWVMPQVSKYAALAQQRTDITYNSKVVVFANCSYSFFAVASSDYHASWIRFLGGSLKTDISYSVADVFNTFPFPPGIFPVSDDSRTPLRESRDLEKAGFDFYRARLDLMKSTKQGLTLSLNRFHDPSDVSDEIESLRRLFDQLNKAVGFSFGWTDLKLETGFHDTLEGIRFTISEPARREVLQRLLKLNHERYAEEVKKGLHGKKKTATKKAANPTKKCTPKKKKASNPPEFQQPSLFDEGEVE
jgi:hypothetical protein